MAQSWSAAIEEVLFQFDQAWGKGAAPAIEEFLQSAPAADTGGRRLLLEELVKIDLEYRWRQASSPKITAAASASKQTKPALGSKPRLEDYLVRFPELGPLNNLSAELIGSEYWV